MKNRGINLFIFLSLIIAGPVWSQHSDSWKEEMKKIAAHYKQESLGLDIAYHALKDKADDYVKIDRCTMLVNKQLQFIKLSDYETLYNGAYYIKAGHTEKELFIFKPEAEMKEESIQQTPWKMDESDLEQYKVSYDSLKSDLLNGRLVFSGVNGSNYHSLEFDYDPKSYQLYSYTINYATTSFGDVNALKLEFGVLQLSQEELEKYFEESNYFTLHKDGKIELKTPYKAYKLIKNF